MALAICLMAGLTAGIGEFFILASFTASVTRGKPKIVQALLFVFLPLIPIVLTALFSPENILWTGVALTGALIVCAVVKFILGTRKDSEKPENENH